jgi:hypothetical protein
MNENRNSRIVALALAIAMMSPFLLFPAAQAHAPTFLGTVAPILCANPNGVAFGNLYLNQGPAGKTWQNRVWIGLWGGADTLQDVHFEFYMLDQPGTFEVANYRDAGRYWIVKDAYVHSSTLTAHVDQNFDLRLIINNVDPALQCFQIKATAAWF